jgi:hypothetical protein
MVHRPKPRWTLRRNIAGSTTRHGDVILSIVRVITFFPDFIFISLLHRSLQDIHSRTLTRARTPWSLQELLRWGLVQTGIFLLARQMDT